MVPAAWPGGYSPLGTSEGNSFLNVVSCGVVSMQVVCTHQGILKHVHGQEVAQAIEPFGLGYSRHFLLSSSWTIESTSSAIFLSSRTSS